MTPKQAGKSLLSYSRHHRNLQFSIFVIPQVPGDIPRSRPVRGVLESLVKSKRYAVPLVTVAVLHPAVGGGLAFAWLDSAHFDPRRIAEHADSSSQAGGDRGRIGKEPGYFGHRRQPSKIHADRAPASRSRSRSQAASWPVSMYSSGW
jgi:hypothetical protein